MDDKVKAAYILMLATNTDGDIAYDFTEETERFSCFVWLLERDGKLSNIDRSVDRSYDFDTFIEQYIIDKPSKWSIFKKKVKVILNGS